MVLHELNTQRQGAVMNKIDIVNRLNELENCEYVNFHFKNGDIYSCQPKDIIVYLDDEYINALNKHINFHEISYLDSYNQ